MTDERDCHPDAKIIWDLFQRPSPAVDFWELDALVDTLLSPLTNDLSSTPSGDSRVVFIEEVWNLFQRSRPSPDITELDEIVSRAMAIKYSPIITKNSSVAKAMWCCDPTALTCCGFVMNRRKSEINQDSYGYRYRVTLYKCDACNATKSVSKTL